MGLPPLPDGNFDDLRPFGLDNRTPLWFYVLREASDIHSGEHLGPVGGRIVAEVFIGLLEGDENSYFAQEPDWQPFLPTVNSGRQGDDFRIVDLLRFAGVA